MHHQGVFRVSGLFVLQGCTTRGCSEFLVCIAGMHHQGVFRVSGSQHEINDMKNAFEKGQFRFARFFVGKTQMLGSRGLTFTHRRVCRMCMKILLEKKHF